MKLAVCLLPTSTVHQCLRSGAHYPHPLVYPLYPWLGMGMGTSWGKQVGDCGCTSDAVRVRVAPRKRAGTGTSTSTGGTLVGPAPCSSHIPLPTLTINRTEIKKERRSQCCWRPMFLAILSSPGHPRTCRRKTQFWNGSAPLFAKLIARSCRCGSRRRSRSRS